MFRLWITLKVGEEKENPCSRRGEETCTIKLELSGKDLDKKDRTWIFWNQNEKFDEGISYNFGDIHPPKKAAYGDAKIIFRITDEKGKKTYYSFEIPIEIR